MIKKIILGIIGLLVVALLGLFVFAYSMLVVPGDSVESVVLQPTFETTSVAAWEAQRAESLQALQQEQYGVIPTTTVNWQKEIIYSEEQYEGLDATFEIVKLSTPDSDFALHVVAIIPSSETSVPMVVASNFCPHHVRYGDIVPKPAHYPPMCESEGFMSDQVGSVFGEYLTSYPINDFVANNVALVNVFLAEGVADDVNYYQSGLNQVKEITDSDVDGVLAAWAWQFMEVVRVFEADERIDQNKSAVFGHSRDGKAALLAAAFSEDIDLVLAHQSGKGGAAPWQLGVGESIEAITDSYPFWFTSSFSNFIDQPDSLIVDQHHLVASIAPRPVLLSAAKWDKWGDPAGVLVSAQNATKIYELYGATGVTSDTLMDFDPELELSYFMRTMTHGVRASDWDAFFAFMRHHFELD